MNIADITQLNSFEVFSDKTPAQIDNGLFMATFFYLPVFLKFIAMPFTTIA